MLIRFVVSNFLSFDKETEFNMLSGAFKTHKPHVYNIGKVDVLKAAAIYGANGAGKSNLIKAIKFLQDAVEEGAITESVNNMKFKLNKANKDKPVTFEIEFSIEKKIYSYGVSFDNLSILEEWLYESGINIEDKLIFERKQTKSKKTTIQVSEKLKKTLKQKLLIELMEENLLKNNELFIGKTETFKSKEFINARKWIVDNLIIIFPGSKFQNLVPMIAAEPDFNIFANELLKTFDTGVSELRIETTDFNKFFGDEGEQIKNDYLEFLNQGNSVIYNSDLGKVMISKEKDKYLVKKVVALHKSQDNDQIPFDLVDESDGTQRLLDLIPAVDIILHFNDTFIIDEIDRSLHPALIRAFVQKIMNDETTLGQLVFSTHESNLIDLGIFRQDEIWFAEKDKAAGSTQLYSLSDYKPRYDLDIRKGYLQGRFGAIPFLDDLKNLDWNIKANA